MKQFFKIVFASALGAFISVGFLFLMGFCMLVAMISSLGSLSAVYVPKADEKVFRLPLTGNLRESSSENRFSSLFGSEADLSLRDALAAIGQAAENDRIEGIYLDVSTLSAGTASLDALRRALTDFRSRGKFVVAYADHYTQKGYYLSSVADRVFLHPQGLLQLTGIASQTMFYRGILKKAGIEMQVFQVGTYKGAVEPFMLERLSAANREQITSYQQGIWRHIVANIASSRRVTEETVTGFIDQGGLFAPAERAMACGLVDALMDREEVESYLKERTGVAADQKLKTLSPTQMKRMSMKTTPNGAADEIAVVYAEGEIIPSAHTPQYSADPYITEKLVDELIELKGDERVKAVVLRVNSPGGSAFVSEQICKQVADLKRKKKIVVSMGDVAASGGYYISCAADRIVSEVNTLTGSIGVFGLFPNMTGLFDKVDLTTDVVQTNRYSDLGDVSRPMREDEKALIQGHVEHIYEVFLGRCAEGRAMSREAVHRVGQGRVWTGEQAMERGLVDETGGLDRAVEVAAELAGLTSYSVRTVSGSTDRLTEYLKKQLGEMKSTLLQRALGGTEMELFRMLQTAARQTSGIQTRLPYDFTTL
jgi:protease-4